MTDNEITRKKTFGEELPYFKERIKEVFDNYHNTDGSEDPLHISILRDSYRIVLKAEEEIARQQAEIDKLNKHSKEIFENWKILDNRTKERYTELYEEAKKVLKSEAYKEFAKRLENEINIRTTYSREQDKNVIHIMHNLLKEMVGDTE